jgi:hypothetical protein
MQVGFHEAKPSSMQKAISFRSSFFLMLSLTGYLSYLLLHIFCYICILHFKNNIVYNIK